MHQEADYLSDREAAFRLLETGRLSVDPQNDAWRVIGHLPDSNIFVCDDDLFRALALTAAKLYACKVRPEPWNNES